jgi:hypothetical protein
MRNSKKSPLKIGSLASSSFAVLMATAACGNPATENSGASQQTSAVGRTRMPRNVEGTITGTFPCQRVPVNNHGHLMTGGIALIPIFYGSAWQANYQTTILSFLRTMSASSYWQIVEGYTDFATGGHPGAVTVEPAINITDYPFGNSLTDANIQQVVQTAIATSTSFPTPQQIYMVFTADDVNEYNPGDGEALCASYLGWHAQGTFEWSSPQDPTPQYAVTQYAFVGSDQFCINHPNIVPPPDPPCDDAGTGPSAWNRTPNGPVIDTAITAAMHEAAEAATDPNPGTGVYPEIGDICAWEPGPLTTYRSFIPLGNGRFEEIFYDYDLGGGVPYAQNQYGYGANQGPNYLVQTLWDTNQNACAYGPVFDDLRIPIRIGF